MNKPIKLSKIPWVSVLKGLICSSLNLVIFALIAIFIVGLSQGFVIPIDIYTDTNPLNLVINIALFHFLIYFLGLIMSLYPTYIYAFLFERKNKETYYTSRKWGLIYYTDGKDQCQKEDSYDPYAEEKDEVSKTEKYFEGVVRKFLGAAIYIVWSWLLVYVYYIHQIEDLRYIAIGTNAFFTIVVLIFWWRITFILTDDQLDDYLEKVKAYHSIYGWIFLLALGLFCLVVCKFEWHIITVILQAFICMFLAIHLLVYRNYRKDIKHICDIRNYLCLHRKMGVVVLGFLVAANISISLSEFVNPINFVLAGLIAFYTVITIIFKIYLFLKYPKKESEPNVIPLFFAKLNLKGYVIGAIFSFILFIVFTYQDDKLHQLEFVDRKNDKITLSDFYLKYRNKQGDKIKAPILYAAYGGGLKAHYWNLMILDKLDKEGEFNNILAMSGVSGGSMGIGNFAAMKYLELDTTARKTIISEVSSSNILSIQLPWFFGYDFIRKTLPNCLIFGKDRAHRSLTYYADILNAPKLVDSTSFYDVYSDLHKKYDYFPNIIINSTSITDKYGVVSGVMNDSLFPGSSNLLDIHHNGKSKTLTFFEALSTSNRFPVISPAASIPTKGQFVDGGYFENSGIMSLISFKKALGKLDTVKNDCLFDNQKIKLLSIRNGKRDYLQSLLKKNGKNFHSIQDSKLISNKELTELKAIIGGIVDLDRMPNYIKSMLTEYENEQYEFIDIDLPYYIRKCEIEELFGGKINTTIFNKIEETISKSNKEIVRILKKEKWKEYKVEDWGVVNPPTARILSRPVEIYMEAMMEHSSVVDQLEKLK